MWLRRGVLRWLFPAVLALPLWLLVGWAIFSAGAGTLLSVLFVLAPAVFVGELVLALLIRLRPTVRQHRAASWRDVIAVVAWHGMVVALGCFIPASFGIAVVVAALVYAAAFWSSVVQLTGELRAVTHAGGAAPGAGRHDVFVVREAQPSTHD